MNENGAKLELYFSNCENPELLKTVFSCPKLKNKIIGQRTTGLLPNGTVSFKWTQCSKALAMLFVNAKIYIPSQGESTPLLEGHSLSPAASLAARLWKRDYAWIHDVFGSDKDGSPIMRDLLIGINIRRKTKATVQLFLRTSFLSVEGIKIFLGGVDISDNIRSLKKLSAKLTSEWSPGDNGRQTIKERSVNSDTIEHQLAA